GTAPSDSCSSWWTRPMPPDTASSQPGISFPGFPALPLAGALVTAGTYSRPTPQVLRTPKLVHVDADLRDQPTGGHPVHSWNGAQLFHFLFKRAKMLSDFLLQQRDIRCHKLPVFHQFLQQEPMMRLHAPFQGSLQLRNFVPQ